MAALPSRKGRGTPQFFYPRSHGTADPWIEEGNRASVIQATLQPEAQDKRGKARRHVLVLSDKIAPPAFLISIDSRFKNDGVLNQDTLPCFLLSTKPALSALASITRPLSAWPAIGRDKSSEKACRTTAQMPRLTNKNLPQV